MHPYLVIIPTYNEAENIEQLTAAILATGLPLDILLVDDQSPDGTGVIAHRLARSDARITVIHRPHRGGIGTAYVEGFMYALELGYAAVVQMDADFSHHPRYLHQLVHAGFTHDMVLGSRYVAGGGVSGWPWYRRTLSRMGSWYARTILGLPYSDLTGGYKVISRAALRAIDPQSLRSNGYVFQIETTHRAHQYGFRIREEPIVFAERARGASKINKRIIGEAIVRCIEFRFRR